MFITEPLLCFFSGPYSSEAFEDRCLSSSSLDPAPSRTRYPSYLNAKRTTLDLLVVLKFSEQEKDEYFQLVQCFLISEQFLNRIVDGPTQRLLDSLVGYSYVMRDLPFLSKSTIVFKLSLLEKAASMRSTRASLTSGALTTSTNECFKAAFTSGSSTSLTASSLEELCKDLSLG